MAKTRGGSTKPSAHVALRSKKRKAEEVLKTCKKKKIIVEESEPDSETETMAEIDNYQSSRADASNVESSERESDSEESSRDASRDEDDPLSLTIFPRDIPEFALITGLNCSAYPRESKLNKVLRKCENFHFKVTRNKNITGAKLMRLINSNKLNKEQKLKCSLVWFVHSILLSHDRSKIVDSNHIKMEDDLNFFKSYPWGKQSFDLALTYLKNRINLRKQGKMYNEKKNASYALYGFPWTFLVWIDEAFPYLGKYTGKSLDTPLSIPCLLRWYTSKSDDIVEGDPFKYKGRSMNIVHPYLTPAICEMGQNYMKTFKPYMNEVKDTVTDVLKKISNPLAKSSN
ncbi:hypothetical protein KY284_001361 [Solanum tuberosum]|nr:hypothetical protein KY284_001361 [Solanum tuberosum]